MTNHPYHSKALVPATLGFISVWVMALTGCSGSQAGVAPVIGRVTIGGKGVPRGTIVFYPEKGRPAMGELDADGHYRLSTFSTGDGAILGAHRVTIQSLELSERIGGAASVEEELRGVPLAPENSSESPTWIVPEPYADRETTPLKANVVAGSNKIDLEIPTKR